VSGSKKPAIDGTLIILAAGDRSLFDDAMPAFSKMGKRSLYLGGTGAGARMKLVVNMIMGGMMGELRLAVGACDGASILFGQLERLDVPMQLHANLCFPYISLRHQ
jgi:3-hydroxyisobutyrate dehydrogenase-like beta-hydroxyacid dehydrogenase